MHAQCCLGHTRCARGNCGHVSRSMWLVPPRSHSLRLGLGAELPAAAAELCVTTRAPPWGTRRGPVTEPCQGETARLKLRSHNVGFTRIVPSRQSQGAALGWIVVARSGRRFPDHDLTSVSAFHP